MNNETKIKIEKRFNNYSIEYEIRVKHDLNRKLAR